VAAQSKEHALENYLTLRAKHMKHQIFAKSPNCLKKLKKQKKTQLQLSMWSIQNGQSPLSTLFVFASLPF